jgi:hypothetical protein
MGVVPMVLQGDPRVANTETGKRYAQMAAEGRELEVFGELIAQVNKIVPADPNLNNPEINASVWTRPSGARSWMPPTATTSRASSRPSWAGSGRRRRRARTCTES